MKSSRTILIVEDSTTQAMQLRHSLEESGYQVLTAGNGREALEQMAENHPTIVISDIMMPEMDGYELCRRLKTDDTFKETFVILLTSLSEPKDVLKGLQCGADKFLTKPYDEEQLLSVIDYLLNNPPPSGDGESPGPIEITYGGEKYVLCSGRLQILSLLISTYDTAVRKNIEFLRSQQELKSLNRNLEAMVNKRTAALRTEVSERKEAQAALQAKNDELRTILQQLWQTSKLATMGELAASIAHELNNPLATVNLRVESLLGQLPPDDSKHHSLRVIEQEVERMGNLVANLLQFSRRSQQEISTIDVAKEVENTLELVYYHLRKHQISLIREFFEVPAVHADRQQLRQLFLNLFTNSSDAMPQGGTLTIRISLQEEGLIDSVTSKIRSSVSIEISDTGVGIPPENIAAVMEPFFTTKPEGKGTGLGLPICKRIAQEHGGEFRIESTVGHGTTVRIDLPVTEGGHAFEM